MSVVWQLGLHLKISDLEPRLVYGIDNHYVQWYVSYHSPCNVILTVSHEINASIKLRRTMWESLARITRLEIKKNNNQLCPRSLDLFLRCAISVKVCLVYITQLSWHIVIVCKVFTTVNTNNNFRLKRKT